MFPSRRRVRTPPRPRPLAPNEGGASPSFVRNFVRAPIPKLLSERFHRTAHLFADVVPLPPAAPPVGMDGNIVAGSSAPAGGNHHRDESDEDEDDERRSEVSRTRGVKRRGGPTVGAGTGGGGGGGTSNMLPPIHRTAAGSDPPQLSSSGASDDALPNNPTTPSNRHADSLLPAPRPYAPFPLHSHSSFAPGSLSPTIHKRHKQAIPLSIRAKYAAYAIPPTAQIAQMIERSDQRARLGERRRRCQYMRDVEAARARWGDPDARERDGVRMAEMARSRMKEKMARALELRENEVQMLVEGQPNAIDAIVLKEHLALRPRRRVDMHRVYTDSDRVRVDRLLAG
ncbi:hypothetical protein HDU86_001701 [Geranomyces michiganensis]|nr:hypothetical protein HDU86_001701 [Geranomyces michiganensis]